MSVIAAVFGMRLAPRQRFPSRCPHRPLASIRCTRRDLTARDTYSTTHAFRFHRGDMLANDRATEPSCRRCAAKIFTRALHFMQSLRIFNSLVTHRAAEFTRDEFRLRIAPRYSDPPCRQRRRKFEGTKGIRMIKKTVLAIAVSALACGTWASSASAKHHAKHAPPAAAQAAKAETIPG